MTESRFHPVHICGLAAVKACFQHRPAALKKLWFAPEHTTALAEIRTALAREKHPFAQATHSTLAHIAGHTAHGGVIALTERPLPAIPKPADFDRWRAEGNPLVLLDDLPDPLQLGAIARVAAACGVKRLLLGARTKDALFEERAWSTANGALDTLTCHDAGTLSVTLRNLSDRFCIAGFVRPGGRRIDDLKPIKVPGRPLAIVFGDTPGGLGTDIASKCEFLLHIPGVEGNTLLNASDAAAFGLPWLLRKERTKPTGFLARKRARHGTHANDPSSATTNP
ncbi:MAG: hypothetical protein LBD14_01810 [Puniceicoccales bacterium]|jgi:TrmH RNA methyltransferase|nr:hypothetical protein [Puniceicoccales bacterium]